MATFKALNLESDSESDDEVDNTKEIQIEEALKLYQAALKFHSEGPPSYEKAKDAYATLFKSEIFKYTESFSEYRRSELFGDQVDFDYAVADDLEAGPVQLVGSADSAPNTLPQILHLSFKNHGQLLLDILVERHKEYVTRIQEQGGTINLAGHAPAVIEAAILSLGYFAEALDKDDADLGLWSKTASVALVVGSARVARFCLEAVLDGDDEGLDSVLKLPGLQETRALQQLRELAQSVQDDLSLYQPPLSSWKRKKLSAALKKRLVTHTYPQLTSITTQSRNEKTLGKSANAIPHRMQLTPANLDWAAVGSVILHKFRDERSGFLAFAPGSAVEIVLDKDNLPLPLLEASQTIQTTMGNKDVTVVSPAVKDNNAVDADSNPALAQEDVAMDDAVPETSESQPGSKSTAQGDPSTTISRKRSTESAGLPETADGVRGRSKRLRARESVTESTQAPDAATLEMAKQLENQLWNFEQADHYLFTIASDLYRRIGVDALGSSSSLRTTLSSGLDASSPPKNPLDYPLIDLYAALQVCTPKTTAIFLENETVDQLTGLSREAGLNAFLGNAKSSTSHKSSKPLLVDTLALRHWLNTINEEWISIRDLAVRWAKCLLMPGQFPSNEPEIRQQSSYIAYQWPGDLKKNIVNIIVDLDEFIFDDALSSITALDSTVLDALSNGLRHTMTDAEFNLVEYVQTLFELHLDVYSVIKHPSSQVDMTTQVLQRDRLEKWALLATDALNIRGSDAPPSQLSDLALRHIWATAFHVSVCDDVPQRQIIACIDDAKATFSELDDYIIQLQNNAIMPELSVAAADRELARINMKDFFLRVFDHDEKDPVAVIESLEPILEPSETVQPEEDGVDHQRSPDDSDDQRIDMSNKKPTPTGDDSAIDATPYAEMRKFLENANSSLRLSLWQRLREAYEAIEYYPKVISCYFRSIELIINGWKTSAYSESPEEQRFDTLFSGIRIIDEILFKILANMKSCSNAFECLDEAHLKSSVTAIAELLRVLTVSDVYEDLLRVGQLPAPMLNGRPNGNVTIISGRLHDMHIRAWTLHYLVLKEGMAQNPDEYTTANDDRLEFLRHIHYAVGIRLYGHAANRVFLRLLKDELVTMTDVSDQNARDAELCQTLYDLYGLKCFTKSEDSMEYGSPAENLDRKTASQLLPFVMSQAHKLNIRDLPKTELKAAVDKVHGALGRPKANEDMAMNRKVLNAYLKSPVNPMDLYQCLKGVGTLSTKPISHSRAIAASKGWYFLMGNIALNKFRSQKRVAPGPTEDINFAAAFFMQDLEYSMENWETWYRLAQAYDTQLEEAVSWTAEKLNTNHHEIVQFQRNSIHCYAMAVACAVRKAEMSSDEKETLAVMYADFGLRIYSSSREPFSMQAFHIKDSETRFYSGASVYPGPSFEPLRLFTAWKLASALFQRAIRGKPDRWMNHYMHGKCLWKMHRTDDATRGKDEKPTMEAVLDAFVRAIDTLPEKKDARREPTLEPHYKLVSIVEKQVRHKSMDHETACEALQATRYARSLGKPDQFEDWESYVLQILKHLRAADKSGWHHRMTARAAHVIYDDDSNNPMAAIGAKHELTQQILTKTMAVQVWKPENERPGRHFVYTTRYTRFFLRLLVQLSDRPSLEALAKRVRKRTHEFYEHTKLWHDICLTYLKLLRRAGNIPESHEEAIFKSLGPEEFALRANRLHEWAQSIENTNPLLEIAREAVDLKKVNNGLMKSTVIDDLISDTYATMYATVTPNLPPLPSEAVANTVATPAPIIPFFAEKTNMMSLTQLMNNDATADRHSFGSATMVPSQPQPQPEIVPKPRLKTVGRREILRRAEAAVTRPVAPPTAARVPAIPQGNQLVEVFIRSPIADRSKSVGGADVDGNSLAVPNPPKDGMDTSAPGSVHDSADDESELTQLEDDEEDEERDAARPRSMFPNLISRKDHLAADDTGASSAATPEPVTADEGLADDDREDEVFEEAEEEQAQGDDAPEHDGDEGTTKDE